MTKTRSTKRALILCALSILVCVSMLVGSTFAWFTDSVVSGNNIIQSGNLDVEMYWADGTEDPATTTWTDASTGAIFNYDLWEPGYTSVRHIKIENAGSLALKYQLTIVANGEVSKLADVIDVYCIDPAAKVTDRDDLASNGAIELGTLSEVLADLDNTANGNLKAGENESITLVLKMQESAGNEYQNLAIGTDFSVQLLATQYTYEKDSFDDQYDFEATYINKNADGEYEISSVGQLYYLTKTVAEGTDYAGEKFVLTNDLDLENKNWKPIGSWDTPFSGSFDGQGHTISNLYINAPEMEEVGLFGCTMNATIANINVKNVNITGYSQIGTIAGCPYVGCTISNCHVTGDINIVAEYAYAGGIAGYGYLKVDKCSVIATAADPAVITAKERNAVGGITAWLLEGAYGITNSSVENLKLTGWANIGSITGFVHYSNTISGCSVKNVEITKTREGANPSLGALTGGWCASATNKITISDNTVDNVTLNGNAKAYDFDGKVYYGSEYGGSTVSNIDDSANNTYTNIKNNVALYVANNTALTAAINAGEKNIQLGASTYSLPTLSGKDGVTIIGTEGTVIGGDSASTGFGGNFGKNTTIKNITFTGTTNGVRYSNAQGGTTVFENCTFAGDSTYGFHIDESKGATFIFNNCTFSGFNAFAGDLVKVTFNNCTFLHNGNHGHTNIWSVGEFYNCTFGDGATYGVRGSGVIYVDGVQQ